ncbi:MAG TPA: DEAD/DEAH box helicase [Burkholderiales bacterium]|nr:DEAD/DEAH box helicase [Burkholderiales bacterium]
MTTFAELDLLPELQRAVAEQGYTEATPIQVKAIPLVLEGRDLMGAAQTGTGKTAGFVLPILQKLARHASTSASPARHPVRALILTPTRELAVQVEESVRVYGKHLPLRATVVYGGVPMDPQTQALRRGVEILVATPGRLLDHVQQKQIQFNQVEFFVLDEADRMMDMGFMPDVRRIISLLPKQRQNLLFSATFSEEIKKLADSFLKSPVMVEVARRNSVAESVTHIAMPVARERKRELLGYLAQDRDWKQVLVFCATRLGANRLAYQLNKDGLHATAIHGDKTQPERQQALEEFKSGKVRLLVATDVAARGLDIEDLPLVVNFDLPTVPEDYVHRIGRTGRAGASGSAIALVSPDEHERLEAIEKLIKLDIPRELVPGFEPDSRVVSSMIGSPERAGRGDRSRGRGRDAPPRERGRESGWLPRNLERNSAERRPAERHAGRGSQHPADPIFSRPYEPSAPTSAPQPASPQAVPSRPKGQIAALLGGLPKPKSP